MGSIEFGSEKKGKHTYERERRNQCIKWEKDRCHLNLLGVEISKKIEKEKSK